MSVQLNGLRIYPRQDMLPLATTMHEFAPSGNGGGIDLVVLVGTSMTLIPTGRAGTDGSRILVIAQPDRTDNKKKKTHSLPN